LGILTILDKVVGKILKVAIVVITIIVVTSMTLQICSRYFIKLPFLGLDEFTGHTAVWFYMLGASYAASRSDHIKADLLEILRIPIKAQFVVSLVASAISIVVSAFMVVWSYKYVLWSISRSEVTPSLQIPTVYFQVAILVGAILLFFYFVKELFSRILRKQPLVKEEYESQVITDVEV
jgi:TRAP-type C4-dicarboxylate transport system permease small subunit